MICAARSRRAVCAFAVVLFSLIGALLAPAQASARAAEKYAAVVMDADSGEVLYARHPDDRRYPASVTKVMTLYLTFEALSNGELKLTDKVTMSPRAAAQPPSKLGLRAGDKLSVEDAIFALCTKSANDVAVALAEKIAGSEGRFADRMTKRAKALGMKHTRFMNPHGLPNSRHVSTARDLALLSRAILRDFPSYYSYFGAKQWSFRGRKIRNHNHLLGREPGVDGIKTGYTRASGYNLAASSRRDGHRLIAVVLGGRTTRSRDDHVAELLDAGFEVVRRGGGLTVAEYLVEHGRIPADSLEPATAMGDDDAGEEAADEAEAEGQDEEPETPVPAAQARTEAKEASKPAAKTAKPAAKAEPARAGDWVIQVGAFKKRSEANAWLATVKRRWGAEVRGAKSDIRSGGGWHRVRFAGLSEAAATEACKVMKAKKAPCLALRG